MFPLIAILAASPVQAEQGQFGAGVGAGWYFTPAEAYNETNFTVVPRLSYSFLDTVGVEADFMISRGLNLSLDPSYKAFNPRLNVYWNPWYDGDIQLLLVGGPGFMMKTVSDDSGIEVARRGVTLTAGPEFRVPISELLAMRFDGRYNLDLSGTTRDESATGGWELTGGIHLLLGPRVKDADGDGLPDDVDECVNEPEDMDDFQDADGCPDPDNDGDGVNDETDQCGTEAEDMDGFADEDGCPDPDNDEDGILDADDACPVDAGPEGTRGCPDRDGDLVPDSRDRCPDKARNEKIEPALSNGCPNQRVVVGEKKIRITDKIFFATGTADIDEQSNSLLDEIVEVLQENPQIQKVRVEGHTDNTGNADFNRKLSQKRAEAVVEYLVEAGVDRSRLQPKGYGPDEPIAENDTDEGKAQNRRVEFEILERGKGKEGAKGDDGPKGNE
jgi:outer membrane protein OmpA-like peptidoglycan-associated protein